MRRLFRFLPALLVLAGLFVVVPPTTDIARTVLTDYELNTIADAILREWNATCDRPPQDDDALEKFIQVHMGSRGGREANIDLWGEPYGITDIGRREYVLFSTGPNRRLDVCSDGTPLHAYFESQADPRDQSDRPPPQPDDICLFLALGKCESGYRK